METFDMIREVYKDEAMFRIHVFEWHTKFKDGRKNIKDEQRVRRSIATPIN